MGGRSQATAPLTPARARARDDGELARQTDFDGSWTIYDCGLAAKLSAGIYDRFLAVVQDDQERSRRLKRVGIWSLRSVSKALLSAWTQASTLPGHLSIGLHQLYPL